VDIQLPLRAGNLLILGRHLRLQPGYLGILISHQAHSLRAGGNDQEFAESKQGPEQQHGVSFVKI